MQTLDPAFIVHIDKALVAMESVAADLTAAGFGDTPFWIGTSEIAGKRARSCVAFSARKPDLHSAHDTLRWEQIRTAIYRTLCAEVTPLLLALRATAPVLTGPMGDIKLQHTPDRRDAPAHTSIAFNGRWLDVGDLRAGILGFVQRVAHLAPTRNKRISVDGTSRPMIAATMEEVKVFEQALRYPVPSYVSNAQGAA